MWINKLKLLCWKNWIIIKRHRIAVTFELLFPIVVIILTSGVRNLLEKEKTEASPSREFNINPQNCQYQSQYITKIVFSPENEYYTRLMQDVVMHFDADLIVFENDSKLNKWIKNQTEPIAGVLFEESNTYPPKHLKYTIRMPDDIASSTRWETDKLYYIGMSKAPRSNSLSYVNALYYSTCFVKLQNEIDQAFMKTLNKTSKVEKLRTMKTFPYPEVEVDVFVTFAAYAFPVLFVLSMILSAKVLIKNITIERESRLTESMKIMGLSSALYWSSWFMRSFIILLISFTINLILTVTSIISDVPMFANSNPLIIWFFFISYITFIITFCFLVSVIFKKSSRAGIVGSIVFIATVLPYMMYHDSFYRFGYGLKVLFCMLANTNMGQGIKMILMAEVNEGGVGFGNLFKRSADLKFSFGELLFWMNFGSVLQMLLTIYIEKVLPGEFGLSKSWYFPFKFIYRKLSKKSIDSLDTNPEQLEMESLCKPADQEEVPEELSLGIELKNLSKKFGNINAVKNLSLNLCENQITVLLGHNGAGKTTAMSMLTGLYQPTSGTAIINGIDIKTNMDEARSLLGVCPQHDVLFDELTVAEHLEFYCKLKGLEESEEIEKSILHYTNSLGLTNCINTESKALSGGQKRKLSVAIALCGGSKFVIMDEPTSGMDPSSRRNLWDLLIDEKKNRTILITTHFMDEADVLGDRIAIMSEGQLRTSGSSYFLKKRFGTGYRLTCVKDDDGFDAQKILKEIEQFVPDVVIASESNTEADFVIAETYLPKFGEIFIHLEEKLKILNIESFGCSFTSLEDVFLKLALENSESEDGVKSEDSSKTDTIESVVDIDLVNKLSKNSEYSAFVGQIYGMFLKKLYVLQRSWKMIMALGLFSFFAIIVLPRIIDITPSESSELHISLEQYQETETFVEIKQNSHTSNQYFNLFNNQHKSTKVSKNIEDIISKRSNDSLGTVNHKNLIAATFKNDGIIAWFNTQPYHTMPLTVNMINRAILKSIAGSDYDISVTSQPYEMSDDIMQFLLIFVNSLKDLVLNFLTVQFLLIIWPMIFIGHYIKEREIKFKLTQFISGTNQLVFWIMNFLFDYILFLIICLVLFVSIVLFNHEKGQRLEEFNVLMLIGSSYGFSMICFIYAFSHLFIKPSTGETMLLFSSIILCILSAIDYILMSAFENLFFKFLASVHHWLGMMFAPFTLVKMNQIITFGSRPIGYSELSEYITMNILSGSFFFLILLLNDYNIFAKIIYKHRKPVQVLNKTIEGLEEDVQKENLIVKEMSEESIKESNIVLKKLTKTFKDFTAVNQLSLSIKQHECFGLLGVNGAGKTTTFKMMTGDELITSGDIWIKGKCLKTQLLEAHKFIGYCPQFDNCIPELTGREILKIFALIRGIKMDEINELINQVATELDFKQHLDKQVRAYSGGNRRKLSTALALLGNPELIFLDECTTGVDPQARRQIWNAIKKIRDNHRLSSSIVISSHSMDECEALCTRIGIMVAGQFQCLGPVQHLKNKFSKGFVLTIQAGFKDEYKLTKLREKIVKIFMSSLILVGLKEQYLDILTFRLTEVEMKYSKIFKILKEIKDETNIKDYALSQMSLEQVFIIFCNKKDPKETKRIEEEENVWKKEEIANKKAAAIENFEKVNEKLNKANDNVKVSGINRETLKKKLIEAKKSVKLVAKLKENQERISIEDSTELKHAERKLKEAKQNLIKAEQKVKETEQKEEEIKKNIADLSKVKDDSEKDLKNLKVESNQASRKVFDLQKVENDAVRNEKDAKQKHEAAKKFLAGAEKTESDLSKNLAYLKKILETTKENAKITKQKYEEAENNLKEKEEEKCEAGKKFMDAEFKSNELKQIAEIATRDCTAAKNVTFEIIVKENVSMKKMEESNKLVKDAEKVVKDAKNLVDEPKQNKKEMKQKILQLSKKLDEASNAKKIHEEAEKRLEDAKRAENEANNKLTHAKGIFETAKQELDGLKQSYEKAYEIFEDAKLKKTKAIKDLEDAERSSRFAKLELEEAEKAAKNAQQQLNEAQNYLLNDKQKEAEANLKVEEAEEKIKKIKEEIKANQIKAEKAKLEVVDAEDNLLDANANVTNAKKAKNIAEDNIKKVEKSKNDVSQKLKNEEQKLKVAASEIKTTRKKVDEARTKVHKQEQEISNIKKGIEKSLKDLTKELENAQLTEDETRKQLENAVKYEQEAVETASVFQEELKKAKKAIDEIEETEKLLTDGEASNIATIGVFEEV